MKGVVNNCFDFDFADDLDWDIVMVKKGQFHIIYNNLSYVADVVSHDQKTKTFEIQINNNVYRVLIKDRFDDLLLGLGISLTAREKENDVKAPMPGRVVEVFVKEGQVVKKGDSLIVLEAMKMENIIKSSRDGVLKNIAVVSGESVEKNTVLLCYQD